MQKYMVFAFSSHWLQPKKHCTTSLGSTSMGPNLLAFDPCPLLCETFKNSLFLQSWWQFHYRRPLVGEPSCIPPELCHYCFSHMQCCCSHYLHFTLRCNPTIREFYAQIFGFHCWCSHSFQLVCTVMCCTIHGVCSTTRLRLLHSILYFVSHGLDVFRNFCKVRLVCAWIFVLLARSRMFQLIERVLVLVPLSRIQFIPSLYVSIYTLYNKVLNGSPWLIPLPSSTHRNTVCFFVLCWLAHFLYCQPDHVAGDSSNFLCHYLYQRIQWCDAVC